MKEHAYAGSATRITRSLGQRTSQYAVLEYGKKEPV